MGIVCTIRARIAQEGTDRDAAGSERQAYWKRYTMPPRRGCTTDGYGFVIPGTETWTW